VVLLAALLAGLTFLPEYRDTVLRIFFVAAGALLLVGLLGELQARYPTRRSAYEQAVRRRPRPPERPSDLTQIEREVALAGTSAGDVHIRLRPRVRAIAAHRLSARRGIDLETEPGAAAAVLSPAVWELVRPDRESPSDRFAPGIDALQLRAVLDGLESI
jgi:hypothetical protein